MNFEINWSDIGATIAALFVVAVLVIAVLALSSDHPVRYYYLGSDGRNRSYCVEADVNWADDRTVFCTDDINKALDVMRRANETLKETK